MKRNLFLTFPREILQEPLLYVLGRDFSVVPNIQGASVTEEQGLMAVEMNGEADDIERAIVWLREKGVLIEEREEGAEPGLP